MEIIQGGVTAAKGFKAAGINAGIKNKTKKDMAMIFSEKLLGSLNFCLTSYILML